MAWYWWVLLVVGGWTAAAALLSPSVGRVIRGGHPGRGTRRAG